MTDIDRFRRAGMILGGCQLDDNENPVEAPGWIGRFADIMGMDRGNMSKLLSGQRTLTEAIEDRLDTTIRAWRDGEVRRIRIALLAASQIDAERLAARQAQQLAAQINNEIDGPVPIYEAAEDE